MEPNKDELIKEKIEEYKNKLAVPNRQTSNASNVAFNIAVELVAAVIVGLLIGRFLDNLFSSKPLFLIICLIISIIAAFRVIWYKYK